MTEWGGIAIAGVTAAILIPGLVEVSKHLGNKGVGNILLAAALGMVFLGIEAAIGEGLIPEVALPWVRVGVRALLGLPLGMSVCGYYDLVGRAGKRVTDAIRGYVDEMG